MIAILAFAVAALAGLVLIPLGLPGLWVIAGGLLAYGWLTDFRTVGLVTLVIALGLAFLGEVAESWLGFRYARRYGGSTRSGWGALAGGIAGAIVGVPLPVIGSIVGAFIGAFVGAAALEYTRTARRALALGAGWGAVVGRAVAAALKVALGIVLVVLGIVAILRA